MTVAELIEHLKKFDGTLPVVVGGFDESGYDDVEVPRKVTILQDNEGGWHRGKYFDTRELGAEESGSPFFDAVYIDF